MELKKKNRKTSLKLCILALLAMLCVLPFSFALTITHVETAKVMSNSAQITWITDEPSTGRIRFGTTPLLGLSAVHTESLQNHSITLTGLDTDTSYFYEVSSQANGAEALDDNNGLKYSFNTLDTIPPPKVFGLREHSKTEDSITLTWNVPSTDDLQHYIISENGVRIGNASNGTLPLFNHTPVVPGQLYSYKVRAVDVSGNEGQLSDTLITSTTRPDNTPPSISNLDFQNATDSQITIIWQTNKNTSGEVRYGELGSISVEKDDMVSTLHQITLSSLKKNTTYNMVAISCVGSSNCANLSSSFIAGKDLQPPPLNVSIPRYLNRRTIDIIGTTKPFSEVSLFVNNQNTPARVLGRDQVGAQGRILFKGILLGKDNAIKIIAKDKAGNTNQKLFDVSVDTDVPVVALKEIPSFISGKNITIAGSVNEFVFVRVFVRSTKENGTTPGNVSGFHNTSILENAISLAWNQVQDRDFSHYILRRADVGPIAVLQPATTTRYTDLLVDAGKSYAYTISYMNDFGKEGKESAPLSARLPPSGAIAGIKPAVVGINQEFRKPFFEGNATGEFSNSFALGKNDGEYEVKIEFSDRAGNLVTENRKITLDTKIPDIKIISPPTNALVFEGYASEIRIEGKTEPGARVHLYVSRTPFNMDNLSFDITGLKKEIEDFDETKLDAGCRAIVRSKNLCGTNADYSTTADEQGIFRFSGVDAVSLFGGSAGIREIDEKDFSTDTAIKQSRKAKLIFIATDKAGLRNALQTDLTIGTCWSGNLSWDVIPLTEFQSPTILSTERLTDNTESIYFYFNYTYLGQGNPRSAKIKSVSLTKACGTKEVLDPRFNISCQILPAGGQAVQVNQDGSVSYSAIRLNKITGMDRWLSTDWKGFFSAINNELSFPFKVTITYEHEINGRRTTDVQTTCQEVTYVMDNSRIDPRDILPDWLLYDSVDIINQSLSTIRAVQEQIDALMPYVAIGCISAYGANFGTQVWRRGVEIFTEKKFKLEKITEGVSKGFSGGISDDAYASFLPAQGDKSNNDYCKALIKSFEGSKDYHAFRLNYLSDADMEKCFPQIYSAWKIEENTYKAYRYACDRLFGHSTPAKWTQTKKDSELQTKLSLAGRCANDESARGYPVRKVNCIEAAQRTPSRTPSTNFNRDDECLEIPSNYASGQTYGYSSGITICRIEKNPLDAQTNLFKIDCPQNNALSRNSVYALKVNEDNYILPQPKDCNAICRGNSLNPSKTAQLSIDGRDTPLYPIAGSKAMRGGVCTTSQKCISLNNRIQVKGTTATFKDRLDEKGFPVKSARREGFTQDCYYRAGDSYSGSGGYGLGTLLDNPSVVSNDLSQRYECCCIEGEPGEKRQYYDSSDTYLSDTISTSNKNVIKTDDSVQKTDTSTHTPLVWSYRYSKIRFQAKDQDGTSLHTEYNPYRYIDGRDFPACFGFNAGLGLDTDTLMIDSNRQHISAFQCANIGGVQQRLILISNILSSLQTCLVQVRTTGRADSGVCKELFTQYVCSFAWDVIQFFQYRLNGCDTGGLFDFKFSDEEDSYGLKAMADTMKGGVTAVTSTLSDKRSEFLKEYGNAKLEEMFGGGVDATARKICLAAFGYDWPFSVKGFLDASYSQPFATLVQTVTASREYLTIDPKVAQSTYEYRGSWLINPGCDFSSYKVELACVDRATLDSGMGADCTKQKSPDGFNCPCLNTGEKTLEFFTRSKELKQNQLEDKNFHKVVTSTYRYDHFKITLRPNQKIAKTIKERCYPTGFDAGVFYFPITDRTAHDITACRIEPLSGVLLCSGGLDFFSRKGFAYFSNLKINGQRAEDVKELLTGQPLDVEAEVYKVGGDKCLVGRINRPVTSNKATRVTMNGTSPATLRVLDQLKIQTLAPVRTPAGVTARLDAIDSLSRQDFRVEFFDANEDGILSKTDFENADMGNDYPAIIAGVKINPFNTEEKYSSDGAMRISSQGNGQILVELGGVTQGSGQIPSEVGNGGTRVSILNVNFRQGLTGIKTKRISDTITISPPTDSTTTGQGAMTLSVGLYNVRDVSSGFGGISDCNINDPALSPEGEKQERTYTITIVNGQLTSGQFGPSIQPPIVQPSAANPGDAIEVSSIITLNQNSEIKGVILILDEQAESQITMSAEPSAFTTLNYHASIPPGLSAGSHRLKVEVLYRTPKSDGTLQDLVSSSGITSFQVRCNTEPEGICRPQCNPPNRKIDSPALPCNPSGKTEQVCCAA